MARHPRAGDWGLIPGSGRSRRRRKWQPTPSILAWEMPRREEPEGPQSMGRIKVGLNPATTVIRLHATKLLPRLKHGLLITESSFQLIHSVQYQWFKMKCRSQERSEEHTSELQSPLN